MVIPKTMLIRIARRIAKNKVNLKTRKKSGMRTTHTISVKHPVAKSFVSNIRLPLMDPVRYTPALYPPIQGAFSFSS
jgi:hypothetical protein